MPDPDLSQFMTPPPDDVPDLSQFMKAPKSKKAAPSETKVDPLVSTGFAPATSPLPNPFLGTPSTDPALPSAMDTLRASAAQRAAAASTDTPAGGRTGAAIRGATRGVVPAATAGMGAATGAEIGALGGPFDAITVPAGALIGGGLGYWAGKKAQQSVMDNYVPQGALQVMGQDPASVKADQQTYPITSALSESAPSIYTGGALQRAMTNPALVDKAMMTAGLQANGARTTADTINATRAAADRQGVPLPTTLTSPTGYAISRAIPKVFGGSAIETAEAAAPQGVGTKLADLAQTYLKPTEPGEAGAAVQDAAAQWAEKQRLTGGDLIDSAGKQAAGIPLAPTSTLKYIDDEIARLSTNPIANASQIKMLSGLKGDLSNPDNPLDLNSLHDLQSSLYRNAVPEGLSASAAAKTRGDLWNTLSDDMRGGLDTAANEGNTAAHDALQDFNSGTAIWKNRAETIKSTLGKILGGDTDQSTTQIGDVTQPLFVADKAPEDATAAILKMTGGDRRGFKTLMGTLDDDAQDTVRASVIASLGRDGAGNFSAPIFLKQMHAIPDVTRDTLFGADHTAALDDLETITKNISNVQPRKGGFGAYAMEAALAGLLGVHGGYGEASGGILAMTGGNMVAAHLLAQPDTLKWLGRLSSVAGSGDVAPVLGRLAKAATTSPALASLYDTVTQAQTNMANAPPKAAKATAAPEVYDPSKLSDEELGMTPPQAASGAPAAHVPLDPTAYPNKPIEQLVPAVVHAESGGNPNAVSPKGAEGLFQAMPATQHAPGFGVAPVADASLAEKNRVGEDYLHAMIQRYGGQQVLALMAHNWGPGHVDQWVAGGMKGGVPKETRDYVEKILGTSD